MDERWKSSSCFSFRSDMNYQIVINFFLILQKNAYFNNNVLISVTFKNIPEYHLIISIKMHNLCERESDREKKKKTN